MVGDNFAIVLINCAILLTVANKVREATKLGSDIYIGRLGVPCASGWACRMLAAVRALFTKRDVALPCGRTIFTLCGDRFRTLATVLAKEWIKTRENGVEWSQTKLL